MNLFLNEESLHGQYANTDAFEESMRNVNSVLERFLELDMQKRCYRESSLFTKHTIATQVFAAALSHLRDKSLRTQFSALLDQLVMTSWGPTRIHNNGPYTCYDADTTHTSVAEAAERVRQNRMSILITFIDSVYATDQVRVEIVDAAPVFVRSVYNVHGLTAFFREHTEYGVVCYDHSARVHPHESQTVLARKSRFRKTTKRNHEQPIFLEISSGRYWCIDAKHFGRSAHLEVFDRMQKHISKANLDGTLIPGTAQGWYF